MSRYNIGTMSHAPAVRAQLARQTLPMICTACMLIARLHGVGVKPLRTTTGPSTSYGGSSWRVHRRRGRVTTRSGFLMPARRQCLPHIGLRNSKLPGDGGRLDARFEGGTYCVQLAGSQ
jgi:hypothetical protein